MAGLGLPTKTVIVTKSWASFGKILRWGGAATNDVLPATGTGMMLAGKINECAASPS